MKHWYVNYRVKNWNDIPILMQTLITINNNIYNPEIDCRMSAGPYSSKEEAESHRYDIAGYEGVYGVSVEESLIIEEKEL